MSLFDFLKINKTREIDKAIDNYIKANKELVVFFETFENKVKDNEIEESDYVKKIMLVEIKETFFELKNVGIAIESIIIGLSEKHSIDYFTEKCDCFPKYCTLDFQKSFLENQKIEIEQFPDFLDSDVRSYASNMKKIYKNYNSTEEKIKTLKSLINEFKKINKNPSAFETLLALNEEELVNLKLKYAKELLETKYLLDKSLNIFPLPTEMNLDVINIHAYFRKLVDVEFLHSGYIFKRYTLSIPKLLSSFKNELGFYELDKELAKIEKKEALNNSDELLNDKKISFNDVAF